MRIVTIKKVISVQGHAYPCLLWLERPINGWIFYHPLTLFEALRFILTGYYE